MQQVTRDVTDTGLRIVASIPASWTEVPVEGTVLAVGGRLDQNDETLVPSVQVSVRRAESAQATADAVAGAVRSLQEAAVLLERSWQGPSGRPETVAEVAHRSEVTGATQVSMFRSIYDADRGLAVSVVATCGGGASTEARDTLRTIVTGITVAAMPQP